MTDDGAVLWFLLLPGNGIPVILLLTLAIALYLTVIELRDFEPPLHYTWWAWWLLLVFMTHFVGYLALRVYAFAHRRRRRA